MVKTRLRVVIHCQDVCHVLATPEEFAATYLQEWLLSKVADKPYPNMEWVGIDVLCDKHGWSPIGLALRCSRCEDDHYDELVYELDNYPT